MALGEYQGPLTKLAGLDAYSLVWDCLILAGNSDVPRDTNRLETPKNHVEWDAV